MARGRQPRGSGAELALDLSKLEDVARRAGFSGDPSHLLTERAGGAGLIPRGTISYGGGTRLLRARDAWFAITLARHDDVDALPALLECDAVNEPWAAVAGTAGTRNASDIVERARLLGIPAAVLGEAAGRRHSVIATRFGEAPPRAVNDVRIADLSSLWAGPLCGALLADGGAAVVKVESSTRPDGARFGPPAFFERLNGCKTHVALDVRSNEFRDLLTNVDVVIEASRPRALEQAGIDAVALLAADRGPSVWVSITGHGREAPYRDWVAFGDDAAVAGGLVGYDGSGPYFFADAVADPLSGLTAAAAVRDALATGGRWLIDVSMSAVAAGFAT